MARYSIDFSTNANTIIRSIEGLNKEIADVAKTGKNIEINLDTSKLQQGINATFKQLDKEIGKYERQLRKLKIGSPEFIAKAGQIGAGEGLRERGRLQAQSAGLRQQAFAFEGGSAMAMGKLLQSMKIDAAQIKPNTQEWATLQQRIASISIELKKADALAENIQLTQELGALAPGSLKALETRLTILRSRAREIAPDTTEWKELNKEIVKAEQGIERQTRRPLTRGQRMGAAGGAFLYGGGLGGGVGSAAGGIAGGLIGGVPGAFTGAAVGQAVDNLGAMTFAMAEQANAVRRLRLGLASASTDLNDFAEANAIVTDISNRLLVPIGQAYGQFTRLRASTVALGIDTKTTGQIFEGVSVAVLKTGGSMEDVDGAMRAVSQVFSKGKVAAEELRGQLGERLPGAVVKFAKLNNIAIQDLDKAFESGQVSVDQFVTFARGLLKEAEGYSDALANNQEYASARYAKAIEKMQLAIGKAVGPMLSNIQDFATEAINSILQVAGEMEKFAKYMETRFGGGGGDTTFLGNGAQNIADRLIGGDIELKDIDNRTKAFYTKIKESEATLGAIQSGQYKDSRNVFEQMFGGPGEENLRKTLPATIAFYKKQLGELMKARQLAEGKTKGEGSKPVAGDPEADKRAGKFLDIVESREQAIANARQSYEQEIGNIRENAIKQAEGLERRHQDQRLQDERDLARVRRDLAGAVEEESLLRRGIAGEDPALLERERKIADAVRQYTEDKISREETAQDRQIAQSKELEDFKRQNADAINKANERYANAVGKIQREYARNVAKLIEEGSGNGAKKLAAAGKLIASWMSQASAQQTFQQATGLPIRPIQGGVQVNDRAFTNQGDLATAIAMGGQQAGQDIQSIKTATSAARNYFDAVVGAQQAQKQLNTELKTTAQVTAVSIASVSTADIENGIQAQQAASTASLNALNEQEAALSKQQNLRNTQLQLINDATSASNEGKRGIDKETDAIQKQLDLIRLGVLPALAEEVVARNEMFTKERESIKQDAKSLSAKIADKAIQAEIAAIMDEQLKLTEAKEESYIRAQQILRDDVALLEAARISSETQNVGAGLRAGFINEAGTAFENQISKGVSPEVAANVARATEQLTIAKSAADAMQGSINGIGSAFGEAMTTGVASLISGTASAKEVFASFLQSVGQALSQAAAQMIATYIAIGIAKMFAGLGGGGSGLEAKTPEGNAAFMQRTGALGFANGGIAPGGFRAFANGGVVSGPTLGLVGEGKYNEAIVPLPDGKSIPVQLGGRSARDLMGGGAPGMPQASALNMKFETTKINGVEYVSREQLEQAMASTRRAAARDGASRGSQITLEKLRNSPSTRRQLGIN
jgi:tape measure domain-containing protein